MKPKRNAPAFSRTVVSLGGIGFLPKAPGTFGSLVACFFLFFPTENIHAVLFILSAIFFVLGSLLVTPLEQESGNDPQFVVIDEAVGMWLTLSSPLVPHTWLWVGVGFILFRIFDILKPFPVSYFDKKKGGIFVMLDDVAAAGYAILCLHIFYAGYLAFPVIMRRFF